MTLNDQLHQRTQALSRELVELCRARGVTVATAESLTAGLCAASIADIPGASAVLRGGLVVYATDLKHQLAGVSSSLLERVGPVDPDVAKELAEGAAERCGADLGLGMTGVAGPDPQDGHAVGEVFVGVSFRGRTSATQVRCPGWEDLSDAVSVRETIRREAVNVALSEALAAIKS